jgi:thioredoxin-like negative regulator of GroEL
LEKKVNEMENVKLVKINIDTCPEVAQALKITAVPTVYLVHMSQPIDKIEGNAS